MIQGGIRWARHHKAACSAKGCADCATAEGVITLADWREDEAQTEISRRQIMALELALPKGAPVKKSRRL
jgi:hypothetical protein